MRFFRFEFLTISLFLSVASAGAYESCNNGDDQHNGECISIRDCPSLYALILNRTVTPDNQEKLRKSLCGFEGKIPKVCCEDVNSRIADGDLPEPKPEDDKDDLIPTNINTKNLLPDVSECGVDSGKKIYGGEKTELDEFPWMALLTYQLPNGVKGYACGGVLISKNHVLTAAHCIKGQALPKYWKLIEVRLGEYNKDSDDDCFNNGFKKECLTIPPINVGVEETIVHEKYNPLDRNQKHDIALLRLNSSVKFNEYVKPICLPVLLDERKKTYSGANLTVAGWGQTEKGYSSSVKLKLVVPVKSNEICNSIYRDADRELSEEQLCAGGINGKDSCKGDSGGPLMTISIDENGDTTWFAAGIVSYGPDPCGTEGWPGVYTRVSKYMGWILRHMKL